LNNSKFEQLPTECSNFCVLAKWRVVVSPRELDKRGKDGSHRIFSIDTALIADMNGQQVRVARADELTGRSLA
jgi:hypothetical protein